MAFLLRLLGLGKPSPPPAAPPAAAPAPRTREEVIKALCTQIMGATRGAPPSKTQLTNLATHWRDLKKTISPELTDEIYKASLKIKELYVDRIPPYFNKLMEEVFQKKLDQIEKAASSGRADYHKLTSHLKTIWVEAHKSEIGAIGFPISLRVEQVADQIRIHYNKSASPSPATTDTLIKLQRANFEAIVSRLQTDSSITTKEHAVFTEQVGKYWANIWYQAPYRNLAARLLFAVETLQTARPTPELTPIKTWILSWLPPDAPKLPAHRLTIIDLPSESKAPVSRPLPPSGHSEPAAASHGTGMPTRKRRVERKGAPTSLSEVAPPPPPREPVPAAPPAGPPAPIRVPTPPSEATPPAAASHGAPRPELSRESVQRMADELATRAMPDTEVPTSAELIGHLSNLHALFSREDCYALAGHNSLDNLCKNFMESFFKLDPEEKPAVMASQPKIFRFILNYAMRTILNDADTLMDAVIQNRGKLSDAHEDQYKKCLNYFNCLANLGTTRTRTEESAAQSLRTFLRAIYVINRQNCNAILSKKPSDYTVVEETLAGRLGCASSDPNFPTLKDKLFRDPPLTTDIIIKKFDLTYRILPPIQLSSTSADFVESYRARLDSGCQTLSQDIAAFKRRATSDKDAAIAQISRDQSATVEYFERSVETFLRSLRIPAAELGNLGAIRETQSALRALLSQVKTPALQTRIQECLQICNRIETTIVVQNAPLGKVITGTSQFSETSTDLSGRFVEGASRHACAFIAAANIKAQLSGEPISHEDAILEGLHHQQLAIRNRLLTNSRGEIEIAPDQTDGLTPDARDRSLFTDTDGQAYRVVDSYPSLTEMDSAKRIIKDDLTPINIRERSALVSELPLEEGGEVQTYTNFLEIMRNATNQYEKVGAVLRLGSAFLSITMQKDDDGNTSITLTDSHGFHPGSGAGELEGRAFTCNFGTAEANHAIAWAANFLTVYHRAGSDKRIEFHLFTTKPPPEVVAAAGGAAATPPQYAFETEVIDGQAYINREEQAKFIERNKALFLATASTMDLLLAFNDCVTNGMDRAPYERALTEKDITFDSSSDIFSQIKDCNDRLKAVVPGALSPSTTDPKKHLAAIIEVCDQCHHLPPGKQIALMKDYWHSFCGDNDTVNRFSNSSTLPPTIDIEGLKNHAKMLLAAHLGESRE